MRCLKCQSENPENAKFCIECGDPMEFCCPRCGATTPERGKFCKECGRHLDFAPGEPLPDLSFDEKIGRIQRYLPEGLTEKILSQREGIEGERKQVTVLFCDLEGFTRLTERIGPEEAYAMMEQVYEILIHKVHDYDGTINEMTGDGILALFGAPIALEDAPQRAIRSAIAIHREIKKFSDSRSNDRSGIAPLRMRIGIHSGPVVVGTLGNDLRVEFKAVGDTVNLASRTEALAEPGTTYVTEETFKLTEGLFRFESLGGKEIKGRDELLNVYQVIAPRTRRTRFDVSAERGLAPFVGREKELELLLDGFERAKAGGGQVFSIVSEAGVGKSRLLYELRKTLVNEEVTFLEGRCLSYSKGVPYRPVIDILKANFDIREGDDDVEIREKVENGLSMLAIDEASTLPYLLELLSVEDSGIDRISMSPEARKDRTLEALKRIVLRGSEIRPLIMAFEDIHWVDKSSEVAFKYIMDSIPRERVLLIFTYRPEFVHTWEARSFHSQVNLNRLSNREGLSMLISLLGTENIDSVLQGVILEKTEGVPFFIEQLVRSLTELKIIEKKDDTYRLAKSILEVAIPSSIQDIIMARVDSLPEGAKEVLQAGSVIDREFSYMLIKNVTGLPEQKLQSHFSALKDTELLYERGVFPQNTYIFKHALTQEVVYSSILARRRKKLHERVGNAMQELYRDNIDEHYGILSEHFIESENYEKGAEYSRLTARQSEKTASLNDAITYAEKGVDCLQRLPQTDDVLKKLIDARTALGLYYLQMNYVIEAKKSVEPIVELALERDYKKRLSQIYTILGTYKFKVEEDYPKGIKDLEHALQISEEVGDIVSSLFAKSWLGFALSVNCEFDKARKHLKTALDFYEAIDSHRGISVGKSMISTWVYYGEGNINLSSQTSCEAVKIAEESGDVLAEAFSNTAHGYSCYGKGFFDEAIKYLMKGADSCERMNNYMYHAVAQHHLGESCFEIGEYQTSIDHYGKAILLWKQMRIPSSWMNFARIGQARSMVMNNEKDIDLDLLYGFVNKNKVEHIDGWMRRYIADILLNIDDQHTSEAKEWIEKAIEADRRNGTMLCLGWDYARYAEVFKRKGDQSRVKESLNRAIEIYKECGADGWVIKAEKELVSLSNAY